MKETGNNFNVANGTGAAVRAGINDIFSALRTINSASGDPSGTGNVVQFQPHIDSSTNLLKICTAVSSGTGTFTTIGNITQANLGLAPVAGATFTGKVTHNYTSSLTIPSAQLLREMEALLSVCLDITQLLISLKVITMVL